MAWQIVGHSRTVEFLRQSLAIDRAAHAYLFSGPPQIGKTRLARTLAQALNCTEQDPPCGQCRSCRKVEQNSHPDVQIVEGQSASGGILIDQVRALQREAVLRPYEGRYRVFILRHAGRATPEAADSLLKTLEEPPAHVVLILTAVHAETLPSTVVSRCQRLDMQPAPIHAVEEALLKRDLDQAQAQLLARLSAGRMGWAVRASEEKVFLQQRQRDLDQLITQLSKSRGERISFAWEASRDSMRALRLIESWIGWWRDLLLLCGQGEDHIINTDRNDELLGLARNCSVAQAWKTLKSLQSAASQIEANVNARLAMESLLLQMPHWPGMMASQD